MYILPTLCIFDVFLPIMFLFLELTLGSIPIKKYFVVVGL